MVANDSGVAKPPRLLLPPLAPLQHEVRKCVPSCLPNNTAVLFKCCLQLLQDVRKVHHAVSDDFVLHMWHDTSTAACRGLYKRVR
jgi:hypothetical protein